MSLSVASTKPVTAQDNAASEYGSKDSSRALFLHSQQPVEKEAVIDKLSPKSPERKIHPKSPDCSHVPPAKKTIDVKHSAAKTVTVLQTKPSLIDGGLLSCSTNAPFLLETDKPTKYDLNVLQANPGLTNSALLSCAAASSSSSYTRADDAIEVTAGARKEFETSIVDDADTLHNEPSESNDVDLDEGKAAAPSEYMDTEDEDFEVEFETDDTPLLEDLREATVVVLPPKRRSRMLKVSPISSCVFILHQNTHIKFELTSACLVI